MMTDPVNLPALDSKEFKKFVDSFDYILSDCDGVVFTPGPDPEAGKWINFMKELGKKVYFVSNNSLLSKENHEKRFKSSNIENGFENLTVPPEAIAEYFKSINFNKHIYCVACPRTIDVLISHGFKVKTGPEIVPENYLDFYQYLDDDLDIGAVVFDCDFSTNLGKMHKAVTYLRRDDVIFIHGPPDTHFSMRSGTLSLGPVVFSEIVAKEVNKTPILLAKPGEMFADFALKRAGLLDAVRRKVLFIGDMIEQDIQFGKNAGFQTLLVLTNESLEKMRAHKIKPDYYAESLASLVPQVEELIKHVNRT